MTYTREQQIDDAFFALSHPVRRAVLEHLAQEDLSVSDVSKPFNESPSQMTKHLHILERAGMLSRQKVGRVHKLHMEPEPLKEIMDWLIHHQKFWDNRLDALESYLHTLNTEK
ncbi:MAG: metalloregulator ArsR/SmtB family transcription factor [Betaproteobacteria bacterium]|nr:metalloregulator ArsR/SmtB family transcription factor [Betaproteobacteria bacterium]